jgi:hypothetical protein
LRDAVPIPPLKPNATVPVPAPTEPSATGFGDEGINRLHVFVAGQREHVVDEVIRDTRHTQCRGQQDRRFDFAEFVDLRRACEFAEAIADEDRAGHFFAKQIAAVWQNRGDSGAHVIAADESRVADKDAADVRDGVEWARRKNANRDAGFARAWSVLAVTHKSDGHNESKDK